MIAYIVKYLLKQFCWAMIILAIALCVFQNVAVADELPVTDSTVALHGIVTGKVQKVGFRAFLFKLAIQYNFAGWDQNLNDGSVEFVWQGKQSRINQAVAKIPTGDTSSVVDQVVTKTIPANPELNTFVVRGWTSVSRHYFTPTDLTFKLRDDDTVISAKAAQKIYKATIRPIVGV